MDAINATWLYELVWRDNAITEDGRAFCEVHPSRLNSYGVWEKMDYGSTGMGFWEYPFPLLEIMLLSASVLWLSFDILFKKLGFPITKFSSMMLAGVVLSQASLASHNSMVHEIFFPDDYRPKLPETLGAFGFVMYWFVKGVTMDVGMLKSTGKKAGVIGVATLAVPMISGSIFFRARQKSGSLNMSQYEYITLIFMQSVTAFTDINMLLKDVKINHTEFGRIAQSSAMVTDLFAFLISFWARLKDAQGNVWEIAAAIVLFSFSMYILRRAMFWVISQTPEGRPVKDIFVYVILMFVYLSFFYFKHIGLFGPAGSFALGLAIPDGPPLGSVLVQKFESFNNGIFLPLFGSLSMMQLDLPWLFRELGNLEGQAYEAISFILFITVVKFTASTIAAFAGKMPLKDSVILSLILSKKGIFELAYFMYAVEEKALNPKTFTIAGTYLLVNSLFIPIAIHFLYDQSKRFVCYRKRNLFNLKPTSELRTLVCINKPDNITSMINFLEVCYPSEDSPIACYIIHLIELAGQASPTFISHQMQKPKAGSRSYSDNVITSFRSFHKHFPESTSVHMFTSVSATKHMHEDICWLALDKSLTLILLPFHRTWSLDRSRIVSDDETIRNLNRKVLKRAPCSVGILVYRHSIWETTQMIESRCQVCLIFVGGKDDREALALANRMRQNREVSLTCIRFIPATSPGENHKWVHMLDMVDLQDIMRNSDNSEVGNNYSVTYIEKTVVDGTETSAILRSVAYDFDLFIVGRSTGMDTAVTRGLSEWTEFEEVGVIGDLLASPDYPSRASVLVVQQQEIATYV